MGLTLTAVLAWIGENPGMAAALGYAALNVLNAVLKHQPAGPALLDLGHQILDRLCVVTRSDSPGTLKAPLASSLAPIVQTVPGK